MRHNYGHECIVSLDIQVSDIECCGILQLVDWVLWPLRLILAVLAFLVLPFKKTLLGND
jgi:hypothetical protein